MNSTKIIFEQFKFEWNNCSDGGGKKRGYLWFDLQDQQDIVLNKYQGHIDEDPELNELIDNFINVV